jgi:hypothetical protein
LLSESTAIKGYKRQLKPGLNVFNEKGEELDWDYEHDTRFYEKPAEDSTEPEPQKLESKTEEIVTDDGRKIKSRGRGSKKFLAALSSMDSD